MWQYVDANQFSPRLSFTYKPFENTTFHAGYARYFTPPVLVEAAPANIALFNDTTGAPASRRQRPGAAGALALFRRRRRSENTVRLLRRPRHKTAPTLDLGLDAYYKIATDLHRQRHISARRWCSARSTTPRASIEGVEFSAKYHSGNFQAYGNLAVGQEKATNVVSNQYLFDNATPLADLGGLTEFQYIATHWIYTDHNQFVTGSAGASYQFCGRLRHPAKRGGTICAARGSRPT